MMAKDWKQFSALMDNTADYYRQSHLSNAAMKLMFEALKDLSFEAVSFAVTKHISGIDGGTARFCPNAADLRLALIGTPEQQACEAWVKVQEAMAKLRSGSSVRFDRPEYHYAIKACGGWIGLCEMTPNESEPLFRRYFATAVRASVRWGDVGIPEHLCGRDELNNSRYNPWTPEMIRSVSTQRTFSEALQIAEGKKTA